MMYWSLQMSSLVLTIRWTLSFFYFIFLDIASFSRPIPARAVAVQSKRFSWLDFKQITSSMSIGPGTPIRLASV